MKYLLLLIVVVMACSSPEKPAGPPERKKPTKDEMCRDPKNSEIYKLFCE